ncbi:hypothetical protein SK128_006476 [Halocaridina rubra]|uniref:Uncharacterized protein n=1 Tax=Halocaridina rubra TaxID=373956 RepID=A0AAN8ZW85_HALRR
MAFPLGEIELAALNLLKKHLVDAALWSVGLASNEQLADQDELIDVNPMNADSKYPEGRESTISISELPRVWEVHRLTWECKMRQGLQNQIKLLSTEYSYDNHYLYPAASTELRRSSCVSRAPPLWMN